MMRIVLFLALLLLPFTASAKPLVADLSQYRIDIDSSFNGIRLLLFGSRNDIGDIVVVVHGPEHNLTVRRKERVAGIWVNRKQQKFENVPLYYAIASSKPFADMRHTELFSPLRIGQMEAIDQERLRDPEFAGALIDYAQKRRLYSPDVQKISFMGETLFKMVIPFPDTTPRGDYSADVYLFNDGELMGMQSIPLYVEKIGFDAFIYDFAHNHSALYGIFAVLLALSMGWGASTIMRKL